MELASSCIEVCHPPTPPAPWHAQDSGGGGCGSNLMLPYSMSDWRISVLSAPSGTARTWTTFDGGGCSGEGAWVVVGGGGTAYTRGWQKGEMAPSATRATRPPRRCRKSSGWRPGRGTLRGSRPPPTGPARSSAGTQHGLAWFEEQRERGGRGAARHDTPSAAHRQPRGRRAAHGGPSPLDSGAQELARGTVLCRKPVRGVRERASAEPHR